MLKQPLMSQYNQAPVVIPDGDWDDVPIEIKKHAPAILTEMKGQGILEGTRVKVCVVLDVSGSMDELFKSGKVQILLNKALAMARCLDDDGSIEIFPFATRCSRDPIEADFTNYQNVVSSAQYTQLTNNLGGGTCYAPAVEALRQFYFLNKLSRPNNAVYALFVTDGEPGDKNEMKEAFRRSSYDPVFWKVIALGSPSDLPSLQALDDAPTLAEPKGRSQVQCNFMDNFDLKTYTDPSQLSAEDMVDELPQYLQEAFDKGLFLERPNLNPDFVNKPREAVKDKVVEDSGCFSCSIL